jgi:histidyl-tRNA synthetase
MDLLNACNKFASKNNIEEFSNKLTMNINDLITNILNAKPKEFRLALNSVKKNEALIEYIKRLKSAEVKSLLKEEIKDKLKLISVALIGKTYMAAPIL